MPYQGDPSKPLYMHPNVRSMLSRMTDGRFMLPSAVNELWWEKTLKLGQFAAIPATGPNHTVIGLTALGRKLEAGPDVAPLNAILSGFAPSEIRACAYPLLHIYGAARRDRMTDKFSIIYLHVYHRVRDYASRSDWDIA